MLVAFSVTPLGGDVVATAAPRVSVVPKADGRPGVTGALIAKVARVESRLAG